MKVNVFECNRYPGEFRVEAFDDEGGCEVAIFAGPRARERAHSFAAKEYGTAEMTEARDEREHDHRAAPTEASDE